MTEIDDSREVTEIESSRGARIARRLISGVWLGSAIFLAAVAAPAAFRAAGSPVAAADVVGAMLNRWHYIGIGLPAVLVILEWKRGRNLVLAGIIAGVVFAVAQAGVDLRIRSVRAKSPVPISFLPPDDPVRRQFGMLHGVSMVLLLAQIAVAALAAVGDELPPRRKEIIPPVSE